MRVGECVSEYTNFAFVWFEYEITQTRSSDISGPRLKPNASRSFQYDFARRRDQIQILKGISAKQRRL